MDQQRVRFLLYSLLLEKVAVNNKGCQSVLLGNLGMTVVPVAGNEALMRGGIAEREDPRFAASFQITIVR